MVHFKVSETLLWQKFGRAKIVHSIKAMENIFSFNELTIQILCLLQFYLKRIERVNFANFFFSKVSILVNGVEIWQQTT